MKDNKLNIDKYIHFGYSTYAEYMTVYGDVLAVEDAIVEDAKKYLNLLRSDYKYTLDKLMLITDISNRTTIQVKFMPYIRSLYIVKPVKNLLYILAGADDYCKQYKASLPGGYISFLIDTESNHNDLVKKIMDFYDIDKKLINFKNFRKDFLRKKLFFTKNDLKFAFKEVFKVQKKDKQTYKNISSKNLDLIISRGVSSQKTLANRHHLIGSTQFQRYVSSGEIPVALKVVIPNDNPNKRDMARYLID